MAELHMICGLPGSGKTTLARRLEHDVPALYLNADMTLKALRGPTRDDALDAMRDRVEDALEGVALRALRLGVNVVVDNGYWVRSEREDLRRRVEAVGANARVYYLDVAFGELWRRIERRNDDPANTSFPIGVDELRDMARLIEYPHPGDDVIIVRPSDDDGRYLGEPTAPGEG